MIGLEDLLYEMQETSMSTSLPTEQQLLTLFEAVTSKSGKSSISFKECCNALFSFDANLNRLALWPGFIYLIQHTTAHYNACSAVICASEVL